MQRQGVMSSSPLPRRSGWWQSFCDIGGGTIGPCPRQVFIVDAQQSELPLAEDDDDLKSFRLYCVRVHACTTHTSKLSVTGTRLPPADHTATARVSCTTRTRHSSHTHITSAHTNHSRFTTDALLFDHQNTTAPNGLSSTLHPRNRPQRQRQRLRGRGRRLQREPGAKGDLGRHHGHCCARRACPRAHRAASRAIACSRRRCSMGCSYARGL